MEPFQSLDTTPSETQDELTPLDVTAQPDAEVIPAESQPQPTQLSTASTTETDPDPDPSEWGWEDFDQKAPEPSKRYVARAKALYAEHEARSTAALTEREEALAALQTKAEKLEQAMQEAVDAGYDVAPLQERLSALEAEGSEMAALNGDLVVELFQARNPDAMTAPPATQQKFAELCENLDARTGASTIAKLQDAWDYAKYLTKYAAPGVAAAAAPRVEDPAAKQQVLIAGSERSGSAARIDALKLSHDEVLDMHDHLLR